MEFDKENHNPKSRRSKLRRGKRE